MEIAGRKIGPDQPPYLIADMSANHMGKLENALKLIEAAKWAGCDAIKPQLYTPDEMCKPGTIAKDGPWAGQDLYELYQKIQTPREWFPEMFAHAKKVGITLFSSVFSLEGVDYLESLGCPAYKIAANEYDWPPLLEKVWRTKKPILISVPSLWNEAQTKQLSGRETFIPLLNVPGYPLAMDAANMTEFHGCKGIFGFSSHVMDSRCMIMAVALGASIIEAHLALDLRLGGPDVTFSWEPHRFRDMVDDCHAAWRAMRPREITLPGYRRNPATGLREVA